MSDLQVAVDGIARAQSNATNSAKQLMARHLRRDHGWGIRKIGRELGWSDKQVREVVDDE